MVAHVGSTGYTANGYRGHSAIDVSGGGSKPSVTGLIPERAIYDFLLIFAYDKMFERFPNLRIASVENRSDWPHMEGMERPRDILEELEGIPLEDQAKILYGNTAALNERRPA